jgi:hypothetical protein
MFHEIKVTVEKDYTYSYKEIVLRLHFEVIRNRKAYKYTQVMPLNSLEFESVFDNVFNRIKMQLKENIVKADKL